MSDQNAIVREWSCQQVMTKLLYWLDERRYDDLVGLFASDGLWYRQGKVLKGGSQIMEAMEARSATYTIRHVMTNFLVTRFDGDVAEAVGYVTAYANDSGEIPEKPVMIQAPMSIFVAYAKFRCSPADVKLIELDLKPEFVFPKNA
jgi:hypothetical protein